MPRNLTNTNGNIYINTIGQGEAIELTSLTTEVLVNVSMKQNTTESTAPTESDIIIIADGSTGKVLQYASLVNLLSSSNLFWRANKIGEIYGGTNQNSYTTGDILYSSASNTLSKLPIGNNNQFLSVSGDIPAWADVIIPDLPTSNNFGTNATGVISLGNSQGSSASAELKLYGTTLKLFSTSNVNIATFTPDSSACNLDLNAGKITLNKIEQTGTLSASSLSLLNGALFNDTDVNGNNGFTSLKLNQGTTSTYGFINFTTFGSDIGTFVNGSGDKFSSIGSISTDCDFGLYSGNFTFLRNDPSNRRYTLIGVKANDPGSYVTPTGLTVCNDPNDINFNDARITIESLKNTHSPILVFVINSATDSATKYNSFIYSNPTGELVLQSDSTVFPYVVSNSKFLTEKSVYFTNLAFGAAADIGVEFHSGSDVASTSTFSWKNQIDSSGNLLYQYRTSSANSWVGQAFINFSRNSYIQMNFTGQHRCVPEEEDLYTNVNNYIGMVVEATGLYNSIDYIEEEEDVILEDKVKSYTDPATNIFYEEQIINKSGKRKSQKVYSNTTPTINEAQPIIKLTTKSKSKKVYGVISNKETSDEDQKRTYNVGAFSSVVGELDDNRLLINSIGEGSILVCNQNGNIENGDYICSSDIPGIAMKQDDDFLHNYTIAKATMDYIFINSDERKLIGCTYHCG